MNTIEQIKKEASCKTMNKWIGVIEDETSIFSEGESPTERMRDLIEKIKIALHAQGVVDEKVLEELIVDAFDAGVQCGFAKALQKFYSGKLKTRKVANEESWTVFYTTTTSQYNITCNLPTFTGNRKATVLIKLSEHGFE